MVSDIFDWARIDNVDGISMCMMEEGAAKSGVVEKNVGGVVDFAPKEKGFKLDIFSSDLDIFT